MKRKILLIIILVILIIIAIFVFMKLYNSSNINNEVVVNIEDADGKFNTDKINITLFDYTSYNENTGQYNIKKYIELTDSKTVNTIVNMCNAKDMEIPMHEKVNLLIMNEIELDFNNGIVLYLQLEREMYGYLTGHPDFSGLVYLPDELLDYVKEII